MCICTLPVRTFVLIIERRMTLETKRIRSVPYPRMMASVGFEVCYLLAGQARPYMPGLVWQQIAQEKSTAFAQQISELPVAARFPVASAKQWVFYDFECEAPWGQSLRGPRFQSRVSHCSSDNALHLGEVVPVSAVFIGVAGRRQFLHDMAGAGVDTVAEHTGFGAMCNRRITFTRRLPRPREICRRNP
jgi:hypothetical protein